MKLLPFDYSVRNMGRSPLKSLLIVSGSASIIFLIILMNAYVNGLDKTLRQSGQTNNVILLGLGSEDYLEQSEISMTAPSELLASVEGIVTSALNNQPLISPEIHHSALIKTEEDGLEATTANITVRGINEMAYLVHESVEILEGKPPSSGEVLLGKLAAAKLGMDQTADIIGKTISFEGKKWEISGIMSAQGTVFESEIWAPLTELMIQTKRDSLTCAIARVENQNAIDSITVFTSIRLDLELTLLRESDYYNSLAKFTKPLRFLGYGMAILISISGLFGCLNLITSTINGRLKEFACLEVLGFRRSSIIFSLFQEIFILIGTGSLLAAFLSILLLTGKTISVSMGALELLVTDTDLATGFCTGLALAITVTVIPSTKLARATLQDLLRR